MSDLKERSLGESTFEEGRRREYYNYHKAIPWKEGYRYAARFWLVVSILGIALATYALVMYLKSSLAAVTSFKAFIFVLYEVPAFLMVKSIYELRRLRHIKNYNQVMADSLYAEIPLERLAERAGVSYKRALKDLKWLFKKNLMEYCSLILDEKPRVVLTDILLDIFLVDDIYCTDCSCSLTRIGPEGTVICPKCGRRFSSIRAGSAAAWEGRKAEEWNFRYLCNYQNPKNIERIKAVSSVLYFIGVFFSVDMIPVLLFSFIFPSGLIAARRSVPIAALCIGPLLLCRLLRQAIELTVRCNPFFIQSASSRVSCESIASMMGWPLSKTEIILRLCFVLRLLKNCSWQDQEVMLGRNGE